MHENSWIIDYSIIEYIYLCKHYGNPLSSSYDALLRLCFSHFLQYFHNDIPKEIEFLTMSLWWLYFDDDVSDILLVVHECFKYYQFRGSTLHFIYLFTMKWPNCSINVILICICTCQVHLPCLHKKYIYEMKFTLSFAVSLEKNETKKEN